MCFCENPDKIDTIVRGDTDLKQHSRYRNARAVLLFWTLFIGVGAVGGAAMMLIDPTGRTTGMAGMLPYFQKLPFAAVLFRNFIFSGYALLVVNGLTNLIAAGLLIAKRKSGIVLGGVFGVTLMLWICIQFYMFPLNFMSTIYFIFGFLQAVTGYAAWVFYKQEHFHFNAADYENIGKNGKTLVVYFSRLGYVRKIAYEQANALGADICEIKSTEKTDGTLGFWWCGRFGMHRRAMPIEPITADLTKYDKIIVCSPVWVFSIAAPVRAFLEAASGKMRNAEYVFVHHTNGKYENLAALADEIAGVKHSKFTSIRCRKGKFRTLCEKSEAE